MLPCLRLRSSFDKSFHVPRDCLKTFRLRSSPRSANVFKVREISSRRCVAGSDPRSTSVIRLREISSRRCVAGSDPRSTSVLKFLEISSRRCVGGSDPGSANTFRFLDTFSRSSRSRSRRARSCSCSLLALALKRVRRPSKAGMPIATTPAATVCIPSIVDTSVDRSSTFSSTRSTACLRVFVLSSSLDKMPSSVSGRGGLCACCANKTTGSSRTATRPAERSKFKLPSTRKFITGHQIRRISPGSGRRAGSRAGNLARKRRSKTQRPSARGYKESVGRLENGPSATGQPAERRRGPPERRRRGYPGRKA